jgi:hypothetical protein
MALGEDAGVKKVRWLGIAALLLAGCGLAAWACTDGGYETGWAPESSSGFLTPGNDTRSNFILLMADRDGTQVADRAGMAKGIVPFDFPYKVMVERLAPDRDKQDSQSYDATMAEYGLSDTNAYVYGESSNLGLCHTNRSGAAAFEAALNADAVVPANERAALWAARQALGKACDKAAQTTFAFDSVTSPDGRAFAHYAQGVRLFYAEDLAGAAKEFGVVGRATSEWATETAAYMQFRTALAQAMKGSIGEWGDILEPAKRDRGAIDRADAVRRQYLAAYPSGRYSASARNFERRIAWLRDDKAALGAAYSSMLTRKVSAGALPDLDTVEEIDRRILPSSDGAGVTDPDLLAVADLMRLRPNDNQYDKDRSCCGPWLTQADLNAQKRYFQSAPDLFGYLLAAEAFYHRKQPPEVLSLIPDASHQARFGYTQFSRQMLRGLALEALGDRNARGFWLSLLPGAVQPYQREAVELAIYQHDLKSGVVGRLLETGSPILHPLIRQKIIEDDAGADLLRQQSTVGATAQQREVALYLLLANELHHGRYREFVADQQLVGPRPQPKADECLGCSWSVADYDPTYRDELSPPPLYIFANGGSDKLQGCPDIRATAGTLAADPSAIRPRLCLAEFIREKGLDGWSEQYDAKAERIVSRSRNGFPGKPLERIEIYKAVIASPSAGADDKAFALNRAIRCYSPAGNSSCGSDQDDEKVRKAWYLELKSKYPDSPWAKDLKLYW